MRLLKYLTAATVKVGPVLDSTGAAYTGLTAADLTITKNGTDTVLATDDATATVTSTGNGLYAVGLTTTNTNTANRCSLTCTKTGYAMAPAHFTVLPAATFDALVTNAAGAASGLPLLDGAAHLLAYSVSQGVTLAASQHVIVDSGTVTTLTNLPSIPANWITTAGITDGAITAAKTSGLATPTNITAGTITTVTNLTNAPTAGDLTATMKASVTTAATAATPTAAAVTGDVSGKILGGGTGTITGTGVWAVGGSGVTLATATAVNAIPTNPLTSLGATAPANWINAAAVAAGALAGKGDWGTSTFNATSDRVKLDLTQTLSAARSLNTVADTSLTLNDAFHAATAGAAGQETIAGTTYAVKTPFTATTIRSFTLDSAITPTSRT